MSINFEKTNLNHVDIIFGWLAEPFVQKFCGENGCRGFIGENSLQKSDAKVYSFAI